MGFVSGELIQFWLGLVQRFFKEKHAVSAQFGRAKNSGGFKTSFLGNL